MCLWCQVVWARCVGHVRGVYVCVFVSVPERGGAGPPLGVVLCVSYTIEYVPCSFVGYDLKAGVEALDVCVSQLICPLVVFSVYVS